MTCYEERKGRRVKVTCHGTPREPELPPEIQVAAETEAAAHGTLAGDMIAALTKAIGIPPCGGCKKRQAWLNAAHRWLRAAADIPGEP